MLPYEEQSEVKPKERCCKVNKVVLITVLLSLLILPASSTDVGMSVQEKIKLMAKVSEVSSEDLGEEMEEVLFVEEKLDYDSIRGIYVTAYTMTTDYFDELVEALLASGGNAIVMDIELSGGQLAFIPENPYLASLNPGSTQLENMGTIIKDLHKKGIYVIARQVIFNDPYMGVRKPEWRIKYKYWDGLFDYRWLDPSHPEVQQYNLLITEELARLGVDEVQYDYIRFPAENHNNLEYYYDENTKKPWDVITEFLAQAHEITQKHDIKLGMDVFGAAIWGNVDWKSVGQYIPDVAHHVDVIYPMTYPSHVNPGYYGFQNPWGDPGSFVRESIKKFREAADGNAEIRTWVQGFPLKAPNWGEWYMQAQVNGTYDGGAKGFVIWSPGNRYGYSWSSMGMIPPGPIAEGEPDTEEE